MAPTRQIFVVGWTGMRGGLSLAAALALPVMLDNGHPFPQREFIVFLTFCVILVTLVLQGLTLPVLIRALGLQGSGGPDCEEREARRLVLEAALAHLEQSLPDNSEQPDEVYEDVMGHYRSRLAGLNASEEQEQSRNHQRYVDLSKEAAKVERETAIRLRNEGRINDQVLRRLERELDLTESKYAKTLED
jgi:CPA1 family monovalent cation:H+ antiporter